MLDSPQLRLILGAVLISVAIGGCFVVYAMLPEDSELSGSQGTPTPVEESPVATGTAAPAGAQVVPAPIESVEVLEPRPRQPALQLVAGLPDGCTQPGRQEVTRLGSLFRVQVLNYRTGDICTQVYGTYEVTVQLSSGLGPGRYDVEVNDQRLSFTVQ